MSKQEQGWLMYHSGSCKRSREGTHFTTEADCDCGLDQWRAALQQANERIAELEGMKDGLTLAVDEELAHKSALRAELEQAGRKSKGYELAADEAMHVASVFEAKHDTLSRVAAGLVPYLAHWATCATYVSPLAPEVCTCGLDDALAAYQETQG